MYDLGLGPAQTQRLHDLMVSHHRIAITVQVLDLDFAVKSTVSQMFLDGQVSYDYTQAITRSLDITLRDPAQKLHFDSASPEDGAMFADRQLGIDYCIISPDRQHRFDIPVFTGPITGMDRAGAAVSLEAQGRDVLGMAKIWTKRTWKKGTKKTTIIRQILTEIMGEKAWRVDVPDRAATIAKDLAIAPDGDPPWVVACNLANSLGCQLFYDGRGRPIMRDITGVSTFKFKSGPGGSVKTRPTAGYSNEGVINAVDVRGKKKVHARLVADREHPLSPWKLGTEEQPRFLPEYYQDDSIKTNAEARAFAQRMLNANLQQSIEVAFDALPYALGEPGDTVSVDTAEYADKFRLRQHTLPLTCGASSSIGYLKNVKPNAAAIRARKAA